MKKIKYLLLRCLLREGPLPEPGCIIRASVSVRPFQVETAALLLLNHLRRRKIKAGHVSQQQVTSLGHGVEVLGALAVVPKPTQGVLQALKEGISLLLAKKS